MRPASGIGFTVITIILVVRMAFAQVDTLGIIYSIEADQGTYEFSDMIKWSSRLINDTNDTIAFHGLGPWFYDWYLVDSSGKGWDSHPIPDMAAVFFEVPPGDTLKDHWTNPLATYTRTFPPGLYYSLLKPYYRHNELPFDSASIRIVNSPPGIEISVSTDKSKYEVGEPLVVYVSIHNPTQDTMALSWGDACQFNYWVDSFRGELSCIIVPTQLILPPDSTHIWEWTHTGQDYLLDAGSHSVMGEVVRYGLSDTVMITVSSLHIDESGSFPIHHALFPNYPNPFNPTTTIEFSVPQAGLVTLTVYDLLGREVETILNQPVGAGPHKVQWNATDIPSGIYFVRMKAGDPSLNSRQAFTQTRKVAVLK